MKKVVDHRPRDQHIPQPTIRVPLQVGDMIGERHKILEVTSEFCRALNPQGEEIIFERRTRPGGLFLVKPVNGTVGVLGTWPLD